MVFKRELEKQIAELSRENKKLDKQIDTMLEDCKRCAYRKTSEQLERAKEIIKSIIENTSAVFDVNHTNQEDLKRRCELFDKVIEEAEQFLKDIEK